MATLDLGPLPKVATNHVAAIGVPAAEVPYPPPVGSKLRTQYGNHCDKLWHVRGHVDGLLVLRRWMRRRQRWQYEVEGPAWWVYYFRATGLVELPRGAP